MIKLLFRSVPFVLLWLTAGQFAEISAQAVSTGIQWNTIEEGINKSMTNPRKLFVYIYSNNCGWCKKMEQTSFSDSIIINYINNNFYPVKLNSSYNKDISLGARTYKYIPADPVNNKISYHELVVTLLNGRLAFPAIVFVNEKMQYMGVEFGFKNPSLLEAWLHFIYDNAYLNNPDFTSFQSTFKGKISPAQ